MVFYILEFDAFSTPGKDSPNAMSLKDVINKLVTSEKGYSPGSVDFNSVTPEFINQKVEGQSFNNTSKGLFSVLNQLAHQYQFNWGVRVNGIGIYPKLKDSEKDSTEFNYLQKNGRALKIDPVKVKGTPIAGMATLEIAYKLDASLFPGVLIDIGEIDGNSDNNSLPDNGLIDYTHLGKSIYYINDVSKYGVHQFYMLWRVIHKGDTHGEEWQSTLICKTPSSGKTAEEEI